MGPSCNQHSQPSLWESCQNMKRGTRLLVGLLGLITALQLFHSYVTFTRHAAETADARPGRAAPQAAGWRRLPSENAPPPNVKNNQSDARGTTAHRLPARGRPGLARRRLRNPEVQTPNLIDSRRGLATQPALPIGRARRVARLAQWATRASRQSSESESPPPGRHDRASRDSRHRRASFQARWNEVPRRRRRPGHDAITASAEGAGL